MEAISKTYGATVAVRSLDLHINQGEFFSLLGPSGCGKTTTLRMLAGFVAPDRGNIKIAGNDITVLPPEQRDIGIVFQNYAIFPHLNVAENIAFGLQMRKLSANEIREKVAAVLEQVGLQGFDERYERELSGGQKQRVALARVLVIEPKILLLDEPLSALDKKMREEMKIWIKDIQKSVGITTIYVTHDQGEALTMSDRMAVMKEGRVLQIGSPEEIYELPTNRFVGEFIGDSNFIDGIVLTSSTSNCEVDINGVTVKVRKPDTMAVNQGEHVTIMVRPESIMLSPHDSNTNVLSGTVTNEIYHGAIVRLMVQAGEHQITVEVPNRPESRKIRTGETVNLHWDSSSGVVLCADERPDS